MSTKKHAMSFQEFLENKKIELQNPKTKRVDWELRKKEFKDSVVSLYNKVDEIIVANLKAAGYVVETHKEEIRISEDYVGAYNINDYKLHTEQFDISFNPIGVVVIGAKGRVDMSLPRGRVKLVLSEKKEWKMVKPITYPFELMDFNEKNIQKVFEDNL